MRFFTAATLLAALPALSTAAEQKGITDRVKDWFDDVSSIVIKAVNTPADAAIAKVAENNVYPLTWHNWRNVIKHSGKIKPYDPPEAIMVAVTGENKTCFGMCERFDRAWNESVVLFKSDQSAPKLAQLNCDREELLCGAWGARTGTILFFLRPQPDQVGAPSPLTVHYQNLTTVSNVEITRIHTRKTYLYAEPYEGMLHPFDGWVHKTGLVTPMAYGLLFFGKVPSWAVLMSVSFLSRTFMNRRMPDQQARRPAAQGQAPAAAAAGGGASKKTK